MAGKNGGPLAGIRVIDCTTVNAMPTAMYCMGDMGAEVIKVEAHTRLRTEGLGPFPDGVPGEKWWNRDGGFQRLNRSKLGITLNLKSPEAIETFKRLVAVSDIVAENNRPGVMERLGLGYEELRKINPSLIYFSFSGFGQTGPWRDYQGIGRMFELTAGVSQFTGYPDESPRRVGSAWFDPPNGWMVVFALLSALHNRERTGKGQYIDQAMYQMAVSTLGDAILDWEVNGRNGRIMGNSHPYLAPHGAYPCKGDDRWIVITVEDDLQWSALVSAMGTPAWAGEERFSDGLSRWKNREALENHISAWTRKHSAEELMALLQEARVPAGVAQNARDTMLDPQMKERGFFELVEHAKHLNIGPRHYGGQPWRMSKSRTYIRRAAPDLGQDNEYVFGEILGMSEAEVTKLYELGAIGKEPEPLPKPKANRSQEELRAQYAKNVEDGSLAGYDPEYKKRLGLE
jgi:benzylsuccinate CoA-transferase BbsF subunit